MGAGSPRGRTSPSSSLHRRRRPPFVRSLGGCKSEANEKLVRDWEKEEDEKETGEKKTRRQGVVEQTEGRLPNFGFSRCVRMTAREAYSLSRPCPAARPRPFRRRADGRQLDFWNLRALGDTLGRHQDRKLVNFGERARLESAQSGFLAGS